MASGRCLVSMCFFMAALLCIDARLFLRQPEGEVPVEEDKKQMNKIEVMRADMCLERENLKKHNKCMDWFTRICKTHSSGNGACQKLWDYLAETCNQPNAEEAHPECTTYKKHLKNLEEEAKKLEAESKENSVDGQEPGKTAEVKSEEGNELGTAAEASAPSAKAGPAAAGTAPGKTSEVASEEAPHPGAPAPAPGALVDAPVERLSSSHNKQPESPEEVKYTKERRKLPEQGYDEHSERKVQYDGKTNYPHDWQQEWPRVSKTEGESLKSICDKYPDNAWCHRHVPAPKKEKPWYHNLVGR